MAKSSRGSEVRQSGLLHERAYRGAGPAVTDLIVGQVQVMFATMPSSIEYVRAGKLRTLAVTSATRSAANIKVD